MRVEPMRRLQDMHSLHNLPPQYLKTIEWNLRKEMTEVDKVRSLLASYQHILPFLSSRPCEPRLTLSSGCQTIGFWRTLASG